MQDLISRDQITIFFAAQICALLCSVLGVYLNMRRQAMLVDVLSHSSLPGIVISYALFTGYSALGVSLGAAICSFLSILAIDKLSSSSGKVKPDASMAVIFTSMFALGLLLIAFFADRTHIDIQCALFGELLFSPFWGDFNFGGILLPAVLLRIMTVGLVVLLVLKIIHRKLVAASFWGEASELMGLSPKKLSFALAFLCSLTVMASFELVGAVLVIAFFSIPPAFGRLWGHSWQSMMKLSAIFALVSTSFGLWVGWTSNLNLGGAIATLQLLLFLISFAAFEILNRRSHERRS